MNDEFAGRAARLAHVCAEGWAGYGEVTVTLLPSGVLRKSDCHFGKRFSMATYAQIQQYVRSQYGFMPQTCWIAHVKEMCGLNPRMSSNRYDPNKREKPCPPDKVEPIKAAFRHFGMIK